MSLNMILSLLLGISMTIIIALQISPNLTEQINATKVQAQAINNQEVIFEAIKRYISVKQKEPMNIQELIDNGYIPIKVKDNGFGGTYEISVDVPKGIALITTTIEDVKVQEVFLNSYKSSVKPIQIEGTDNFETKFVIPHEIIKGNTLVKKEIPIQNIAPNSNDYKYWYDTSSGKAILKIYDKESDDWIELKLGS